MAFPARYASACSECGTRIHIGDPIVHSDDHDAYIHASCDSATPEQAETVCPKCFLSICDCGKDV
jgi:hypothetical protein